MKFEQSENMTNPDFPYMNYRLEEPISDMVVIGCGGTGSHLIPNLIQAIKYKGENDLIADDCKVVLIDSDVVEEKNLLRQKFVASDVGKNKAEVLAIRYAKAYGVEVSAITSEVSGYYDLSPNRLFSRSFSFKDALIFGCVDNNATRKIIEKAIRYDSGSGYWIDAGNDVTSGQIFVTPISKYDYSRFPSLFRAHPNMKEKDSLPSELSCAERAVSSPQSRTVNLMAATAIMNVVNDLVTQGINYHEVIFSVNNLMTKRFNYYRELPNNSWEVTGDARPVEGQATS